MYAIAKGTKDVGMVTVRMREKAEGREGKGLGGKAKVKRPGNCGTAYFDALEGGY